VLTDLAVLGLLAASLPGNEKRAQELVILHHTDCGMSRFADPAARHDLADRLGLRPDEVAETMAITNRADSVRADIARLRQARLPEALVVSGLVYDTADGTIEEIMPPAPLKQPGPHRR
jgi:carbonic anhydrase